MADARLPYRADHVGSLLRPQALREARAQHAAGAISDNELHGIEDRAIQGAIDKQVEVGLKDVTDGEFRRAFWHFDFLQELAGVEAFESAQGIQFKGGIQTAAKGLRVVGKLGCADHPMIEHFKFVKSHTRATPKQTIPSPSVLHFRGGRKAVSTDVYPEMDAFYDDLGKAYAKAVKGFADAGCRYLQLDETNFTYLCDPDQRAMLVERGDDPDKLPQIYADMINTAIAGRPDDMTISMHLCRGNFQSSWIASGGYDPVADVLFNQVDVDAYFMEYDDERSGGFEPLRLVPKGKRVVLGVVTSKAGELESADAIKRRIDEAATFCDLDQLCLSPQCGFASTEEGNLLSEEQQWAKLRLCVEVAEQVWGGL
ncbi:MAG: 5-methyltetrahydropteroyltriglutamate--homocysteine S-methyltransferase [Alphaproteobacteria bacterium]